MKNIFITGINGFIGSHLVPLLLAKGYSVKGLVLPNETLSPSLANAPVEIIRGNLSQPETFLNALNGIDTVIHLAARVTDWGKRKLFYESIYVATENLLKAAQTAQVKHFVHASSIAACGMGKHLQYPDENTPTQPLGIPYNDYKHESEILVKKYSEHTHAAMKYTIFRPCNVIGAGSPWVKNAIENLNSIIGLPFIDGGKYDAALIDVNNLVEGITRIVDTEKAYQQIYFFMDDWEATWQNFFGDLGAMIGKKPKGNLSFETAFALAKWVEPIFNQFNIRPPLSRLGLALVGRDIRANTQKARTELGWSSQVSYATSMQRIAESLGIKNFSPSVPKKQNNS
ncbi:MAG: NAD-dependent epimerase/dehydratase family protein [Cytophagales bacterium]|nr:MAG: NAD-dependent epimerase/dehydratase family protein [Cytophagales bacterium]